MSGRKSPFDAQYAAAGDLRGRIADGRIGDDSDHIFPPVVALFVPVCALKLAEALVPRLDERLGGNFALFGEECGDVLLELGEELLVKLVFGQYALHRAELLQVVGGEL